MKKYLILALTVFTVTLFGLQTNADEINKTEQPVLQENSTVNGSNINDSAKDKSSDVEFVKCIRCNCFKCDESGCRKYGNLDEKWTKYDKKDSHK